VGLGILPLALLLPVARPARAIPPFAAQTGMLCTQCHIGAYGPQLTPFGRPFKIGGYTLTGGEGWASHIPAVIMIQPTFTNLGPSYPADSVPTITRRTTTSRSTRSACSLAATSASTAVQQHLAAVCLDNFLIGTKSSAVAASGQACRPRAGNTDWRWLSLEPSIRSTAGSE